MTPEARVRQDLDTLAGSDRGRELLQLSLRSISSGQRQLTAGCWTDHGIAGCLFQHAYWQGVADGVFADDGHARAWVSGVAGKDYDRVIDVIAAFDKLARAEYAVEQRRFRPPVLDGERWRERVSALLVEVLGAGGDRTPGALLEPATA
jgi:hypothetical protein